MKNKIITMTCPSGARVVLEKDENAPYVVFVFNVFKGAGAETPENFGVAHLLEHMIFKSNKKYNKFEVYEQMDALGGRTNASTSTDITSYNLRCLRESFEGCAEIFGQMLSNPLFLEDELEDEKNVVVEEISGHFDDPAQTAFDGMHLAMMSNFVPYAHRVSGTKEDVQKLTSNDLRAFMDKHYVGKNITFSVVGNIDLEELSNILHQHFGKYFDNKSLGEVEKEPASITPQNQIVAIPRDTKQVELFIGFEGTNAKEDDGFTAIIFNRIFGLDDSSRLYANLRTKLGLVYNIYSVHYPYYEFGYTMVEAGVSPQNLEKAKNEIFKNLNDIAENGVTDEEIARARLTYKTQRAFNKDNRISVCRNNAEDDYLYGHIFTNEEINAKLDAITKEDIQKFAQKLLRSRIAICACGPNIKEEQLKINVCQQDSEK